MTLETGAAPAAGQGQAQGPGRGGLVYRVDWENDGTWDEKDSRWSTMTHEFQSSGTYKILLEARDPRWGTSSSAIRVVHIE